MKRTFRKPYRIKKQRRLKSIFRNRFFWLGILVLALMGTIFYFLFLSPTFKVKEIKISGNQKVLTADIKNGVREVLFSEGENIFILSPEKIKQQILFSFPQIGKVNVKREFPNSLIIKVEERKPVAIFYSTPPESGEVNYFLIDKEGVIFEEVVDLKSQPLPIWNLALKKELRTGERVIEEELINQILEVESKLKNDLKIPLAEVLIISEKRLNIKTLEGWEIYLNPKGDIAWQLTKLKAVLEEEIPPEKRQNLEYIELRFGNFAPYKYRTD